MIRGQNAPELLQEGRDVYRAGQLSNHGYRVQGAVCDGDLRFQWDLLKSRSVEQTEGSLGCEFLVTTGLAPTFVRQVLKNLSLQSSSQGGKPPSDQD